MINPVSRMQYRPHKTSSDSRGNSIAVDAISKITSTKSLKCQTLHHWSYGMFVVASIYLPRPFCVKKHWSCTETACLAAWSEEILQAGKYKSTHSIRGAAERRQSRMRCYAYREGVTGRLRESERGPVVKQCLQKKMVRRPVMGREWRLSDQWLLTSRPMLMQTTC